MINPNNNVDNNPTNDFKDKLIELIKKNNYKLTADKIRTTLSTIKNNPNVSSRRWVWELMQNATDVRYEDKKISVKIILNEDKLEFKHNGKYFGINNILGILQQVSSKNSLNLEGQTGKFGTGFIGTHLLSDIIDIKGILKVNENDFKEFQIRLDRSEKSSEELAKNVEKSIEIFFDINKDKNKNFKDKPDYIKKRTEEDYDTCFTYYLIDKEKKKSAREGLDDLINTMPITLITQYKKIEKVTIIDNILKKETTYTPKIIEHEKKNGITESYVQIKTKSIDENNKNIEETIKEQHFLSYLKVNEETNEEILRLFSQFEKKDGIIFLLKRDMNKPVLYRNFPLIGSNEFNMPFIVDGFDFNPLESRDGLFLNGGDNKNNSLSNDNMKILAEAYQTSLTFINCILTKYKNIKNRFILASSKMPNPKYKFDDYSENWFYQKQIEFREGLRKQPLLKFGPYHTFDKLILPIFKENYNIDFFNVVNNLNIRKKTLPQEEDYKNWYDIIIDENNEIPGIKFKDNKFIKSWGFTMNEENGKKEINYIYDEINLLEDLSNCKNIKTLSKKLGKEKSEIINDLNEFLQFLKNIWKEEDILNEYPILPNRNGDFKKIEELYSDSENIIPKPIMDIYDSISDKKLNEVLIDSGINVQYLGSLAQKNFNDVSSYLNEYIKKNENIEKTKKLVVYPLLSIKTNEEKITKIYKFLTLFIKLDQKEIVNNNQTHIPMDLWTHAINFWYKEHPKEIEKYKNITGFHNNLINKNITQDDVLKLINDYLDFLNSKNSDFKIFPNQNGDFCYLKDVHSDSGFPEEFKDILKKYFNVDKRNELLAKEIIVLGNHNIMHEGEITSEIETKFEDLQKKKDDNNKLKDIAFEILCLYPENKEKEKERNHIEKIISPRKPEITYDNSIKNLGFAEIVFNKKDKYNIKYINTNFLKYDIFINYIIEIICDEIGKAGTFENIKNKFYGINTLNDLEEFLSNIIKFIWDTKNTSFFSKNIFLNKSNNLVPKKDISIKKDFEINEEDEKILLDICLNKHINKDYRNTLINEKLYQNLKEYGIDFSKLTLESICQEIDNKILKYHQENNNHNKVYDNDIYKITKMLEKLKIDKEKMSKLFTFYWKNKKELSVNCFKDDDFSNILSILDKEKIQQQTKLLSSFQDPSNINNLLEYMNKYKGDMKKFFSALSKGYSSDSGSFSGLGFSLANNLNLNQEFRFKKKILDDNKNEKIIYSQPIIIKQENIKYYGSYYSYINKLEFELEELLDPLTSEKQMVIKYSKL